MSPTTRRFLVVAVLVAVTAILMVPKWMSFDDVAADTTSAPSTSTGPPPPTVEFHVLSPGPLTEGLTTTGTLIADERIELVSEVAGTVTSIHFAEGRRVAAGTLLLELDRSVLEAERAQVEERIELARLREQRFDQLREDGVTSQAEYESVASELAVLEAELVLLDTRLAKTRVVAPFAGTLGLRRVSDGSYVSPQTVITTLQSLDPIKIEVAVPEKYAGRIRPGQELTFRVKGSGEEHRGTVFAIEPTVDPETRSLTVRARCANPDGVLLPGAFADVDLVVREVDDALTVPSIAVVPELGGRKVWVLGDDDTVNPRPIETGLRTEDSLEVVEGLESGERVVVSGIQRLRPGMKVTPRTGDA